MSDPDFYDMLDEILGKIDKEECPFDYDYDAEWDEDDTQFICDSECIEKKCKKKKCECGATACGSPMHSNYCPLYKEKE